MKGIQMESATIEMVRSKVPKELLVAASRISKGVETTRYAIDSTAVFNKEVVATDGRVALAFPLPESITLDKEPALFNGKAIWESKGAKAITRFEVPEDDRTFPKCADVIPARDSAPTVTFSIEVLQSVLDSLSKAGATSIAIQAYPHANGDAWKRPWRVEGREKDSSRIIGYGAIMPIQPKCGNENGYPE